MKWHREEYIELMTFGRIDRPMFAELFGPLVGLENEWRAQGATEDELNMHGFDWDYVPVVRCGGNTGIFGGLTPRVLAEDADYRIELDQLGRTMKLSKQAATIPLPMDFPVKDMESWQKIKPLLSFSEARIDREAVDAAKRAQEAGALVVANIPGGFDLPRQLMGEEMLCFCYYDQPELMQDILDTMSDTAFRVLSRISELLTVDNLHVHEDMAGRSGPLIGPAMVERFIAPYYQRIADLLSSSGTRIFSLDSDGNVHPVIDAFLGSGVTAMYPMEPAAGMDIVEVRRKYGKRLALKGGIDKHVLRQSKADIRRELEYKMQPLMRGGTVFGLDHRIPNGTPLENYRYYTETGREILGLPPRDLKKRGWGRMAF